LSVLPEFVADFVCKMASRRTLPLLNQVVLNDVFTAALNQAKQKPVNLTQNQQVRIHHYFGAEGATDLTVG